MANVSVTKQDCFVIGIRCIDTGNTGYIYEDRDDCKDGVSRCYRVFELEARRMAHSTRKRVTATSWIGDFKEGLEMGEFEAVQ